MGIINICQIALSMYICTNILTSSVITKSMNDTINYLLMLPITACAGLGVYTLWMRLILALSLLSFIVHSKYDLATSWVPYAFFALSIAEVLQIPLGIAAGRLKSQYMLTGSVEFTTTILSALGPLFSSP
jgi:hypothetical protein